MNTVFYLGFRNVLPVGATFLNLDTLLLLIWRQIVFRLFFLNAASVSRSW